MEHRAPPRSRWTPEDYRQRPRDFDPAIADLIVERVRNGEMLPAICAENRDYPLPGTFLLWMHEDAALAERYALAREMGADVNLDEAVVAAESYGDAAIAGVRSRAIMWHAEKSSPERYGAGARSRVKKADGEADVVDHRGEIRRKIEAMARRRAEERTIRERQAQQEAPRDGA